MPVAPRPEGRGFKGVKLRPHVDLFGGKDPPHLFFASADGSTVVPLDDACWAQLAGLGTSQSVLVAGRSAP